MTTPVFPAPPDAPAPTYASSSSSEFRVREIRFGGGYRQAAPDGINNRVRSYSVAWENVPLAGANVVRDFLDARKGATAFRWTAPGDSEPSLWRCLSYVGPDLSPGNDIARIVATFEEVFD